jgi:hypothetical protein
MEHVRWELDERCSIAGVVLLLELVALVGLWLWREVPGGMLTGLYGVCCVQGGIVIEKVWTLRRLARAQAQQEGEACRMHFPHS